MTLACSAHYPNNGQNVVISDGKFKQNLALLPLTAVLFLLSCPKAPPPGLVQPFEQALLPLYGELGQKSILGAWVVVGLTSLGVPKKVSPDLRRLLASKEQDPRSSPKREEQGQDSISRGFILVTSRIQLISLVS